MKLASAYYSVMAVLLSASLAQAQAMYPQNEPMPVAPSQGAVAPASYFYGGLFPKWGPNASWGYTGTCCSDVWDGYCGTQSCRHCGHRCCHKGGLWRKLMCKRPRLFGKTKSCCSCQQGGCSSCSSGCSQGGCSGEALPEMEAPLPEQLMPPPPSAEEQRPYEEVQPSKEEARSTTPKNLKKPRLASTRSKVHR